MASGPKNDHPSIKCEFSMKFETSGLAGSNALVDGDVGSLDWFQMQSGFKLTLNQDYQAPCFGPHKSYIQDGEFR